MISTFCEKFEDAFKVRPGRAAKLADRDPRDTLGLHDEGAADARQAHNVRRLSDLQKVLYAEGSRAVLIVLQGMDTSGKDGTTRHLLTGVNPQGVRVVGFKKPSELELSHDYLWRVHMACPRRGEIGVFNRSHYEDVGIVRVHGLVPRSVWTRRYQQINDFERLLSENGTVVLKFFLHISKKEQRERLQERLEDPEKHWKMNPRDLDERALWNKYMAAYEDAIARCASADAPWYVIPSDRKWFRNLAISEIVVDRMERMRLRYPRPAFDPRSIKVK